MNTKFFLAALAATVVLFIAGWLVYGMVLMSYISAHSTMKMDTAMWGIILGSLASGFLYAYVCLISGSRSFMKGLKVGIFVALFVALGTDFFMWASESFDSYMPVLADVVGAVILGGVGSGTAGLVLGMGQAKPAA